MVSDLTAAELDTWRPDRLYLPLLSIRACEVNGRPNSGSGLYFALAVPIMLQGKLRQETVKWTI